MKFRSFIASLVLVALMMGSVPVRADESKLSQLQTSLSNTTVSGYVSEFVSISQSGNLRFFLLRLLGLYSVL
jgi:hypothetical protein